MRVKPRRLWRLRVAQLALLRHGRASGVVLEQFLGHFCWRMLVCRPTLAVFDAVYLHVREHPSAAAPLSAPCRCEIWQATVVLPSFRADIRSGWGEQVACFDASPPEFAVCARSNTVCTARRLGERSERWRLLDAVPLVIGRMQDSALAASL